MEYIVKRADKDSPYALFEELSALDKLVGAEYHILDTASLAMLFGRLVPLRVFGYPTEI